MVMVILEKLKSWRDMFASPRPEADLSALPVWQRVVILPMRIAVAVTFDILQGQLTLRAMSLVYTTLLSLVPLLAISFSILKGFGVHNKIEPFLQGVLEPLGEKGVEITNQVIDFVNNVQVGVLGFVGFLLLFYTVISTSRRNAAFRRRYATISRWSCLVPCSLSALWVFSPLS
jgi:membrane protein